MNQSVGKVVDRITILDLKLKAAKLHYLNPKAYFDERLSLSNQLNLRRASMPDEIGYARPFSADLDKLTGELAAVNKELWEVRDLAHNETCGPNAALAALMRRMVELENRRDYLVGSISNLFGEPHTAKIYAAQVSPARPSSVVSGVEQRGT